MKEEVKSEIRENYEITYHTVKVDELDIFYREAGNIANPTILLLHGFPASSFMFRDLMSKLHGKFHLIAPDYPGFGHSSMPGVTQFRYDFDHLAAVIEKFTENINLDRYSLYVQDYGAPVGFRMATRNPHKIQSLIIQNANAYAENQTEFWQPIKELWNSKSDEAVSKILPLFELPTTIWQYTAGARDLNRISPDTWTIDQALLDRPGNKEIQLELLYNYRFDRELFDGWQAYFRQEQPPALIVWGKNDPIFPPDAPEIFRRDLDNIEIHYFEAGHFALEEHSDEIADLIDEFLSTAQKFS